MTAQEGLQPLHLGLQPLDLVQQRRQLIQEERPSGLRHRWRADKHVGDLLHHSGPVGAQPGQNLGGDAFTLADQAQQQMLGPDVVVPQPLGLPA